MSPLPQLYPKTTLRLWGKVEKGVFVPIECHPEERKRRGVSSLNRGGEQTLLEFYPKRILSLSRGKFERGTFAPFD